MTSVVVNNQAEWAELPLWLGSAILPDLLSPQRQLFVSDTQKKDMVGYPAPHQGTLRPLGNSVENLKGPQLRGTEWYHTGQVLGAGQGQADWRGFHGSAPQARAQRDQLCPPHPCTCQEESWGWEPRGGRGEKEAHSCDYLNIPSLEDGETEAGGREKVGN